jgi:hypothetical protein
MFFVALLLIVFCLGVGLMHEELVKILLAGAWAGLALMALGSTLYSVFLLLTK